MKELEQADLVVLVYSNAARASGFIQHKEAPKALEYANAGKCTLILVPLDGPSLDPNWPLEKQLSKFQTATRKGQRVLDYTPHRKGWQEVEDAIRAAVEERRKVRGP